MFVSFIVLPIAIDLSEFNNQQHEQDMLAALLDQRYRDGSLLKDHEIAHIMIALLMAGQHTSSATGSWTLLHLAANPDVAYVFSLS
jgi:sterol 14-demethylase